MLKKDVPQTAFDTLKAAKVFDMEALGNKFDDRKDVTTWVTGATLGSDKEATRVGLKQAWREAGAASDRAAKRQAAGADDDIEAPWPEHVSDAHKTSWNGYYHFRLRPHQQLTDNLMGRIWR